MPQRHGYRDRRSLAVRLWPGVVQLALLAAAVHGGLATAQPTGGPSAAAGTPAPRALAAPNDSWFAYSDRADGISCSFYDVGLALGWTGGRPTSADDSGVPGSAPLTVREFLSPNETRRVRRIDVTAYVRPWWEGKVDQDGFLVRLLDGDPVVFHSREESDLALRPQLALHFEGGRTRLVEAAADAALDCSTYTGLGPAPVLRLHGHSPLALRFDLERARPAAAGAALQRAELVLVRSPEMGASRATLQVSRLVSPLRGPLQRPQDGLARGFPADRGIHTHPDVLFADAFDTAPSPMWSPNERTTVHVVQGDPERRFEPLHGGALRVVVPRGQNLGLDWRYKLALRHGQEPEELYFRYALRFAPDWLRASDGGKLPGFAATYGKAAWGGRPWDGQVGWSMRGSYGNAPLGPSPGAAAATAAQHPAAGKVMLGTYAYHSKADRTYGEGLPWAGGRLAGLVPPNRWVSVEQHLKLNTPGREDGVLRVWVDGVLVLQREDLRIRDRPAIRIEEIWMNVYHGGTAPAPADLTLYLDQVVIARRYIGPFVP